jgi:hypothetical protein
MANRKESRDMGKLTFLHHVMTKNISGDKKITHEEKVVHNERGISFAYFHKEGNNQEKIKGRSNADGTYTLVIFKGDKKDEKIMSKSELLDELKKNKDLKFALTYIKDAKDVKGGKRKVSRKPSRKTSRKTSKKTSRKTSRTSRK